MSIKLCEESNTDQIGIDVHREIDSKVIGYFAFSSPTSVICEGDACVVAGSEQRMKDYMASATLESPTTNTIKKTRFGEIIKGMKMGGPYAFDDKSYKRFYPLAIKIGLDLKDEDFSETETGFHFVVIRP